MSLVVALIGAVMGCVVAWVLVRDEFPARRLINAVIDLPFALPTIVAGLTLLALYGPALADRDPPRVHARGDLSGPAVRDAPIRRRLGAAGADRARRREVEEAARSLGARELAVFRRIVLPTILPGILSGVTMAFARAVGEIGAIVIISGNNPFQNASHRDLRRHRERRPAGGRVSVAGAAAALAGRTRAPVVGWEPALRHEARACVGLAAVRGVVLLPGGDPARCRSTSLFYRTFDGGLHGAWQALSDKDTIHAFQVTLTVAAIAVPLNTIFGVVCALAIVRRRFPGKGLVNAFVDLPLALSPVVVGLSLFLLYGRTGWFGPWLIRHGYPVLFSLPGIVLATIFVSVPFVAREVVPTLREIGDEQEQAAHTLGASGWQTFWRITLPSIRWAVIYGVVLTTARCLGEYGAVAIVSGSIQGKTETATLRVQEEYAARLRQSPARTLRPPCLAAIALIAGPRDHDRRATQGGSCLMSISVQNVSKTFGDFVALDDVSIEVATGSLTALLGPSGSGKSTLLRVIAGLQAPDAGTVFIAGKNVTGRSPQDREIGFVFQHYAAFTHMTVRDNVAFGLKIRKRPRAEIAERVGKLLELVQLEGLAKRYPAQLSGGQRQRMALASALAVQPRVLLLDEPFGALDATVRAELRAWLRRLHDEQGVTTVLVTHDQEEAMEVADRIAVMNAGTIEQVGSPREIYDEPATEFVMGFVGPVSRLGERLVRPHDVTISVTESEDSIEAMVDRVVHLGFEVRLEIELPGGSRAWAQLTRAQAEQLELGGGDIVYVRPPAGVPIGPALRGPATGAPRGIAVGPAET